MSGITVDGLHRLIETLERDAAAKIAELEKKLPAATLTERDALRRQIEEIRVDLKQRIRSFETCLF
jgi:hypothetical protein